MIRSSRIFLIGLLIDMKKHEPGEPGSATVKGSGGAQRVSAGRVDPATFRGPRAAR